MDNGSHFTGTEFHQAVVKNNVKHLPAPRQHPQSVGMLEQHVQLVMGILRKHVQNKDKLQWNTFLQEIVSNKNTRVLCIHGQSPAGLLFGFTPRSHVDQTLDDVTTLSRLDQAAEWPMPCSIR